VRTMLTYVPIDGGANMPKPGRGHIILRETVGLLIWSLLLSSRYQIQTHEGAYGAFKINPTRRSTKRQQMRTSNGSLPEGRFPYVFVNLTTARHVVGVTITEI
jgi:hypothetical protein